MMKKIIILIPLFFNMTVFAFAIEQSYELNKNDLILNNFIADYCHAIDKKVIIPKYNLLTLDSRYLGKLVPPYSTACKGENICWSRIVTKYELSLLAPGLPNSLSLPDDGKNSVVV